MSRSIGSRSRETTRLEREHAGGYRRLPVRPGEFETDDQEDLWGGQDEAEAPQSMSETQAGSSRRRNEQS